MIQEELIEQINQIKRRQIPLEARSAFLATLRTIPSELDNRRVNVKWKRGSIYFHGLQDLVFSEEKGVRQEDIQEVQKLDDFFQRANDDIIRPWVKEKPL